MCGGAVISDYIAPEKIARSSGKSSWRSNGVFDCSIYDFDGNFDELESDEPFVFSSTHKHHASGELRFCFLMFCMFIVWFYVSKL
jgi:hypothetical protein